MRLPGPTWELTASITPLPASGGRGCGVRPSNSTLSPPRSRENLVAGREPMST